MTPTPKSRSAITYRLKIIVNHYHYHNEHNTVNSYKLVKGRQRHDARNKDTFNEMNNNLLTPPLQYNPNNYPLRPGKKRSKT